jgi:competence ComEA-like helix-hairpin-helix protein
MKERPKSGAFLVIALAFLCVYLVKSYYISPRTSFTIVENVPGQPDVAGTRLVYGLKVDINSATAEELTLLPGIGEVLARRIVEERSVSGSFNSINELDRIKGLSPRRLKALTPYITVGG